jgi:hypothetical protein
MLESPDDHLAVTALGSRKIVHVDILGLLDSP